MRIITDSASALTAEELQRYDVTLVPLHILFGEDSYLDGVTLTEEVFWSRLTSGENPKTSQPTPDTFLSIFEEAKAKGEDVVCILLSSNLSGTVQSATLAASMADYDRIYIVDSLAASGVLKRMVTYACELRDEGRLTAAEVADAVRALRSRMRLYLCMDTLEYLARGGRIPKAAASLGKLVQLKPIVNLSDDGKVAMSGKAMGRHRASEMMLKVFTGFKLDPAFKAFPIYSDKPENCYAFAKKLTQAGIPCDTEDAASLSSTISAHIGPGAFGAVVVLAE